MGKEKIVKMMIDKSKSFKLHLEARDNYGRTGYEIAKSEGNFEIITILREKNPKLD